MGIIMRNNVAYSGGGGSETVELSMAEYEAREAAGAIDSDTWYLIYDANDSYNAKKIVYDNAESGMEASTVQGAIDELNSNLTASDNTKFRFATDGEGNYGYLKADDSFVPFKGGVFEHEIAFFGWGRYIPRVIAKTDGTFISKIVDNNDAGDISGDYIKITRNYVNRFIALKKGKYNILAPNSKIEVKECEAGEIIKEFPYSDFAGCFVWI